MNWGTKLVIGMAVFMAFIITLGAMMIMRNDEDSLVEQNYYEKGQNYNKEFQEKQNAADDQILPTVSTSNSALTIVFPVPVKYHLICRRPSDADLDQTLSGATEADGTIAIQSGSMKSGPWSLRIEYEANGKNYLFEDEIVMP